MIENIKEIIREAEDQGTYIEKLKDCVHAGAQIVRVAGFINEKRDDILKQVEREYFLSEGTLLKKSEQSNLQPFLAACRPNLDDFLRYSILAMLEGDTSFLDKTVLNGLEETYKSIELSINQTINAIQALKKVTISFVSNELGTQASQEIAFYLDYLITTLSSKEIRESFSDAQQLSYQHPDFKLSKTTKIPDVLQNAIHEVRQKQYKELDEANADPNNSLETNVHKILKVLDSNNDCLAYSRYIWMGIILGFATKPTVTAYLPNDLRPSFILKMIKRFFFRGQAKQLSQKFNSVITENLEYSSKVSQLCEQLFPHKFEGSQALDEALDVFWNLLRLMDYNLAQEALLESLDDCFDGYAIFPGSQHRRDLFDWWLLDVVPATWCLKFPKTIYTIKGLEPFKLDQFFEI